MPATRGEKIGVGIIVALMIISVLGGSVLYWVSERRAADQAEEDAQLLEEQQEAQAKIQSKVTECSALASTTDNENLDIPESFTTNDEVTELIIEDIKEGSGDAVKAGDCVSINYHGTLAKTGEVFDSSFDRDNPFSTLIGEGFVIPGWDEGIVGLKEGGVRRLVIPAALAYGERDSSPEGVDSDSIVDDDEDGKIDFIPQNSDLVFEVELIDILTFEDENDSSEGNEGEDDSEEGEE